ncbi:VOC family protein [Amnibacterium kyonggiense]|uniref:Catechol 2,3-dioxygenase n=1 Tax=Amnibacterium kyonggiense TaxID=595671 RepID=A0A4V3EB78_9MICO|nr:VOC family protein [Amnibacterium kyonggiense]TDS79944.1 catechol 2,3-dioxygenase [Amnibacterium kyonggiense]
MTDALAPATAMGAVTLDVADLDGTTRYYTEGVGLDVLATAPGQVTVGRAAVPSLVLRHSAGLRHASRSAAGLYHTAVLFDSRAALAAAVYSVATRYPRSFTGSSDHLVSQAFYFDDPEGNGVELYWDRPRAEWAWDGTTVRMATLALDPNAFLREHLQDDARPLGLAEVGHVHLKVGDIATAHGFYVDVLGFDVTARFGDQALFVSAGGYHHHVGMNTWESRGAGPRTPALGLGQVVLRVPDPEALGALGDRLRTAGVAVRDDGRELAFEDPWRNAVRAAVADASPTAR